MSRCALAALFVIILAAGCGTLRKLSYVEARSPASLSTGAIGSPLRERFRMSQDFPPRCPSELREFLPALAFEKVIFPPCPEHLSAAYEAAKEALRMDERSSIEEMISNQCGALTREAAEGALLSLLQREEGKSKQLSRGEVFEQFEQHVVNAEDVSRRAALRESLLEVRTKREPFDQWIRINGEFVVSEDQLGFFDRLINRKSCDLSDQEVDQTYRSFRGLEELARIENREVAQKTKVEGLLRGVNKVMDRKIQEYFRK